MTEPRVPAYETTEPGAIVFLPEGAEPIPFTLEEVQAILRGETALTAGTTHVFHMPGQHDQSSHGRGGATGHDALAAPKISIGSDDGVVRGGYLNPEQAMALRRYRSTAYTRINRHMRGQGVGMDDVTDAGVLAASIKEAMAQSPLQSAITVTRGTKTHDWLPADVQAGDMTGFTFRDKGFVSTSARMDQAKSFTRTGGVSMTITVPAGVGAIGLSDFTDEAEILLDAGLTFRVTGDRGLDKDGIRYLDLEVVV